MQVTTARLLSGYSMQISRACKGITVCAFSSRPPSRAAVCSCMHLNRHLAAACLLMDLHRPLSVPATSSLLGGGLIVQLVPKRSFNASKQAVCCLCGCRWARPVSASLTDADCQKPSNALEDDLSTIEDDDSPGWRCSVILDLQICSMLLLCLSCCCHQPGHCQGDKSSLN